MRNRLEDFAAAGAQVLVIDPHESYRVRHMLKEAGFDPEDLHVPVLADPANVVSATYGVAFQMQIHTEWSNRPAVFLVDRDGILRFGHRAKAYDDRPTSDELIQQVQQIERR
ncbi:redoxin domain-containing protein [Tautonia sociabilis]|uniref:Redoxin domain-containing protein n=1 Tax=Tautonia sociabilis TaxID=2080755 RepID=A0A432MLF7_9BACT|nr:redoxin domain-containing protein [Tautonia sociabilis]